MSVSATGRRRPLQSKPKSNPFLKRSSSSFTSHARTKPTATASPPAKRQKSLPSISHDEEEDTQLPFVTAVTRLPPPRSRPCSTSTPRISIPTTTLSTLPAGAEQTLSLLPYITSRTFSPIPDRGLSSTLTSSILNARLALPPLISVAHLYALGTSPTEIDRGIAALISAGVLRRIAVAGRGGRGSTAVSAGRGASSASAGSGAGFVVLRSEWEARAAALLDGDLRAVYVALLARREGCFKASDVGGIDSAVKLIHAGLATSTSALVAVDDGARPAGILFGTGAGQGGLADAGTLNASGTLAATGGVGALHAHGGGTAGLPGTNSSSGTSTSSGNNHEASFTLALPGTGAYLRLLSEGRAYLLQLITKSSPRHKETLRDMLRERWDGTGMLREAGGARKVNGEWTGVVLGKTRKWKALLGLDFEWCLEECLGTGVVDCFETGSVGLGVRIPS